MNESDSSPKKILKLYHGRKEWTDEHGRPHRVAGPAVIYDNGMKFWKLHGIFHREDGPAAEIPNGNPQFYLFGVRFGSLELLKVELNSLSTKEYDQKLSLLKVILTIEPQRLPKSRNIRPHIQNFQPLQIKTISNFDKSSPEVINRQRKAI